MDSATNLSPTTQRAVRTDLPELAVSPGAFALSFTGEIAFVGQSTTAMPELWLRSANGDVQQITHVNDGWKENSVIAPEFYKYKSFDGLEIEAALLKPLGYDGKSKLRLIVMVHGGPTGNWEDSMDSWGQLLVARGYAVMYPNIRGSIGYGQKFIEMNRADWGGGDFKDVMAGVDDLIAKGVADPDRLGNCRMVVWRLHGGMGGDADAAVQGCVSGAGMADLVSEYGTEIAPSYDEWFWGRAVREAGRIPEQLTVFVCEKRKDAYVDLAGRKDTIDPLGQSQELYRGLKRYGVETELVEYPREPHGFQEPKHRTDVLSAWWSGLISI